MERLDTITVDHIGADLREIALYNGLLITEPAERSTDYLLIDCQPGNYSPEQGGFVAELDAIGVSVEALESTCEMDFRPLLPCWISSVQQGRFFKRLVVFEPQAAPNEAARKAWQVFQALRLFAGNDGPSTLALGILSTHDGTNDTMVMLRVIVFAAASLAARAPWSTISIVVPPSVAGSVAPEFQTLKARYLDPPLAPATVLDEIGKIKKAWPLFDRTPLKSTVPPEDIGLTERQYTMVHEYTKVLYSYLNGLLRADDITSPQYAYFHATIEALSTGLAQMKKFRVTHAPVYRYLFTFPGIEELYAVGAIAQEASYTSTSRRSGLWSGDYRLIINSEIGKDIDVLSFYPNEDEVLFDFKMNHAIYKAELFVVPVVTTDIWSHETLPNTADIQYSHL